MKKFIAVIFITLIVAKVRFAQTVKDSLSKSKINYERLSLIAGITGGAFIYGYTVQNNLWWKGDKSNFHFVWKQDWVYALGEDKYGHFFFPYLVTNIYSQALEWAGFDEEKSLWY